MKSGANKGQIVTAIELVFAAVLIIATLALLVKLVSPDQSQNTQADRDFEHVLAEITRIGRPDQVTLRPLGEKYFLSLYAPAAVDKPKLCKSTGCLCLRIGASETFKRCEQLPITDYCTGKENCLSQTTIIVEQKTIAQPLYLCNDNTGHLTMSDQPCP